MALPDPKSVSRNCAFPDPKSVPPARAHARPRAQNSRAVSFPNFPTRTQFHVTPRPQHPMEPLPKARSRALVSKYGLNPSNGWLSVQIILFSPKSNINSVLIIINSVTFISVFCPKGTLGRTKNAQYRMSPMGSYRMSTR